MKKGIRGVPSYIWWTFVAMVMLALGLNLMTTPYLVLGSVFLIWSLSALVVAVIERDFKSLAIVPFIWKDDE